MSTLLKLRVALVVMIAVTMAIGVPASALAADVRSGDTVVVPATETITDDVYAFGNDIVIDGNVNGALIAAGSTITINGHVTGDVMLAGNTLTVTAPVGGTVRAAGNLVTISSPVAGDAMLAGSTINVNGPGKIGRDAMVASSTATLRGPVGRDVKASAGTLTLASNVGGSVQAEVSDLVVASGASVQGPISYVSGKDASIAPDARFGASVQRSAPSTPTADPWVIGGINLLGFIRGFIGLAALGIVFALVFPRATMSASDVVERHWASSLGLGFGLLVGIPVAALLVAALGVVIGGWWIGLMLLAAYGIFAVLGYLVFAEWAGSAVSRYARWQAHPVRSLLLGLAMLGVVTLVPFVGGLVAFGAVATGLGALTVAGWMAYQGASVTSTPPITAPLQRPVVAAA